MRLKHHVDNAAGVANTSLEPNNMALAASVASRVPVETEVPGADNIARPVSDT